MAGFYLLITLFIIITNITQLPGVFERIFSEAFGFRQVAAGGFGAVLMNGIKRGLFSNEAGSGSAPCAAAAAVAAVVPAAAAVSTAAAAEEDQNDDQDQPHAGAVIVVAHLRFTSLVMLCLILCGRPGRGA